MKELFLLIVGVLCGFVLAHAVSRTPRGKDLLDELDARVKEFSDAVIDGYRDRDAELRHDQES